MRIATIATIAGIVLIIAGAFVFVRGGTFTSRRNVLNVGGMTVTAEGQRPILPWVAGLALVVFVVRLASGRRVV